MLASVEMIHTEYNKNITTSINSMRTKFILSFFAFASISGAIYISASSKHETENDLFVQNVEALTETNDVKTFDYPTGLPYTCKCGVAIGKNFFGTSRCNVTVITCQGGGSGCNEKKCPQHPA